MRNSMLLLLMLALAGCNNPNTTAAQDINASPAMKQPARQAPATAPHATAQPSVVVDRTPLAAAAKLALEGEGLRVFTVATGASRAIPFGIGQAEVLGMLESVQGAPPSHQSENIDCGASNASWPDGLTVWFTQGKFVGWSVASASSPLSTVGGLKIGATREDVEHGASIARIAPSSLGEEFTAGDVAGLLDSTAAGAHVTNLWAGATCIAR